MTVSPGAARPRERLLRAALGLVVLGSRLPFLDAGYGVDSDAWLVAHTARTIAETGRYTASRLPGYPLQELGYSLIWQAGPWATNLASALACVVAVLAFVALLRGAGHAMVPCLWAGLALACVPVVYIASTSSMDYIPALALTLLAFCAAQRRRPLVAGMWLGLAAGFRVTALASALPLAWLLWRVDGDERSARRVLTLGLAAGTVGAACYLPALLAYGPGFFRAEYTRYPGHMVVLRNLGPYTWGLLGCAALGLWLVWRRQRALCFRDTDVGRAALLQAGWMQIGLVLALFAFLPHEAGYLIPLVPFVLLLVLAGGPWRGQRAVLALLILSPFLLHLARDTSYRRAPTTISLQIAGQPLALDLQGPLFSDRTERLHTAEIVAQTLAQLPLLPEDSLVIGGWWLGYIDLERLAEASRRRLVYLLSEEALRDHLAQGVPVYYLPYQDELAARVEGIDLEALGARPMPGVGLDGAVGPP